MKAKCVINGKRGVGKQTLRDILEKKFPDIEFSLVDGEKNNYLTRDATIHICLFDLGKP